MHLLTAANVPSRLAFAQLPAHS